MDKDYVVYLHTDSVFCNIYQWIVDYGLEDDFNKLSDPQKVKYILNLSKKIQDYMNEYIYDEIQLKDFASQEHEYKLNFKQEIIAKSIIIVAKAKYGFWLINKEGVDKDEISVTGLDIIRSETSKAIKDKLKSVMEKILKGYDDQYIINVINQHKKEIKKLDVNDLSANITVNNLSKYLTDKGYKKGTPWHVKGVNANRYLLDKYKLEDKYETVYEGEKAKVIYLKPNKFGFETLTYNGSFPKELLSVLEPDVDVMIEKFFIHKIEMLLKPMNKEHLLKMNNNFNLFF